MRKIILLLSFVLALTSCHDEVEFNNPAFQASINNVFWKSNSTTATKSAGSLTIYGRGPSGDLTINLASTNVGTYELGTTNQNNRVSFLQVGNGSSEFTTGINENPAHSITLTSGGTGYTESISAPTSGGTGSGLKVKTTVNTSGVITTVEIASPGTNYTPGDIVSIVGGGNNASIRIKSVANSNGKVTITENTGATISGKFNFISFDDITNQTTSCREGVFYKVPLQ